jgi:hypothetical protein
MGVADEPVLLPIIELAAKLAIIANVTALLAIVVAMEPPEADPVTFPVRVIVGKSPGAIAADVGRPPVNFKKLDIQPFISLLY